MPKGVPTTPPGELLPFADASGPFWSSNSDAEAKVLVSSKGNASEKFQPVTTFPAVLKLAAQKKGSKPALRAERPIPPFKGDNTKPSEPLESWKAWTYKQYWNDTRKVSKALMSLGVSQHDAVCIFGFNSPEWFLSQNGAICAGAKAAGVYPSDTPDQLQFKCFHSNARVATCEGEAEFNKFKDIVDKLPYLNAIVCWGFDAGDDLKRSDGTSIKVLTWAAMMKLAENVSDNELDERIAAIKPGHCAGLIYTSGTTGNPKAVMVSHDNLIWNSRTVLSCIDNVGHSGEERVISYLPLSHVAGLMVDVICPTIVSAFMGGYVTVHFARPYDLKAGTLGDRLRAVKPTLFLGVPRVWEKISAKIKAAGAKSKGLKKTISKWARGKGLEYQQNCQLGGNRVRPSFYGLANKLVLSKVKSLLGLEHCKFSFTGAAPIAKDTLEFFGSLGININEVYGMSECTGSVTWSTDLHHVWGSVGFAQPGCEVKIFKTNDDGSLVEAPLANDMFNASEEEQGEICFRGRNTMMGYMANPKLGKEHVELIKKKNEEAIDAQGWLHSGDKGCKSVDGMVKITGRYKELIIGAGGENIAPVPIEDHIKMLCPAVSNIMMVGDKRKFNVALVTLTVEGATGELPGSDQLTGSALTLGKSKTVPQAMDDKGIVAAITAVIKETNNTGSVTPSRAAKIQKFTILPSDFSVQTGELTATLKLKRSVVADKYNAVIDAMYNSEDTYVKFVEN